MVSGLGLHCLLRHDPILMLKLVSTILRALNVVFKDRKKKKKKKKKKSTDQTTRLLNWLNCVFPVRI